MPKSLPRTAQQIFQFRCQSGHRMAFDAQQVDLFLSSSGTSVSSSALTRMGRVLSKDRREKTAFSESVAAF